LPYGIGAQVSKDDVCLHWTARSMMQRVGGYWHMLPQAEQARKAIWDAINPHTGKRRIDEAFPEEIRVRTRDKEMAIELANGSTWQVIGSDNYNSLVGSPPVGVVYSEWALADPNAWAYIRPILQENDGWALFISTPRGRNHMATFYEEAKRDERWFAQLLPATDTGVFSAEQLETEEREYIREFGPEDGLNRFRQEYLCSFAAGVVGSYYGQGMEMAEAEVRIKEVPWIPELPVHTGWDLGRRDSTTIWFFQLLGGGPHGPVHLIDYIENTGVHISWYAKELDKRPYKYGTLCLPHDAASEHVAADKTVAGQLAELGYRQQIVLPRTDNIDQDINIVRGLLSRCSFDRAKCARGIAGLQNYRKAWDDKRKVFHDRPLHDWASHPADGFRSAAMAIADGLKNPGAPKKLSYPKLGIV